MSEWTRKIQKTGPQVLGVNLPSSWVRYVDLNSESKVEIRQEGSKLVIEPLNSQVSR